MKILLNLLIAVCVVTAVYWIFPASQPVIAICVLGAFKAVGAVIEFSKTLTGVIVFAVIYLGWKIDSLKASK
ncbi:hypothetical protein GHH61_23545 [Salmonella enterica]|nr:hypothetical protein [Salmonella enterica]